MLCETARGITKSYGLPESPECTKSDATRLVQITSGLISGSKDYYFCCKPCSKVIAAALRAKGKTVTNTAFRGRMGD